MAGISCSIFYWRRLFLLLLGVVGSSLSDGAMLCKMPLLLNLPNSVESRATPYPVARSPYNK